MLCEYTNKSNFTNMINGLAQSKNAELNKDINSNDGDSYVVIDIEKLGSFTVNYGYEKEGDYSAIKLKGSANPTEEKSIFVINTTTHQIYYPKGVFVDDVMYFTF